MEKIERIEFREPVTALQDDLVAVLYKECTPRILVVTDGLNYNPALGFGLTQFVDTLRTSTIHGMTPIVTTASRGGGANADLSNYDFTHPANGLLKSRYDVVFLFGVTPEGPNLPDPQVDAIARFMEAGGGVFATGDHETLGASLCGAVPRVRAMRKWYGASAPPHVTNADRFSTNLSGPNETEDFDDQSNRQPQRLYVNFRTRAGGLGEPHPLLQLRAPRRVLEVFPDHPHEGQCLVPSDLTTTFQLDSATVPEWPSTLLGQPRPEIVAMSVSHGDGFEDGPTGAKDPLTPRLFAAIVAYNGHRVRKGRVVTDSTWHHYININLDGTQSPFNGLQTALGADTEALRRIREYYVNLATWLMPRNVRKCLVFPVLIAELARYPLFEELELRRLQDASAVQLRRIGEQVMQSLSRRLPRWQAEAFAADALEDAVGEKAAAELLDDDERPGLELAQAALGGVVTAVAEQLTEIKDPERIKPHETFEASARGGAKLGAKLMARYRRDGIVRLGEKLDLVEKSLATESSPAAEES